MNVLKERKSKEMADDFFNKHVILLKHPCNAENLDHNIKANFVKTNIDGVIKIIPLPKGFNPTNGSIDDNYVNKAVIESIIDIYKFIEEELESVQMFRSKNTKASKGKTIDDENKSKAELMRYVSQKWRAACFYMHKIYGLSEGSVEYLVNLYYSVVKELIEKRTDGKLTIDGGFNLNINLNRKVI